MAAGNRWIAGGREHSATKSSSLIAATAATSNRPPIRCAITSGPLNAFSIGTCWSKTMPMRRALSSSVSSWSASASPVSQSGRWVMSAILPERGGSSRVNAELLVHYVFGARLQGKHFLRCHQPATALTVFGEEELEAGVHKLGGGLVDHAIGVDLRARRS